MRALWYVVVVVLVVIGSLSAVRVGEHLLLDGGRGFSWAQLLLGILCFLGAWHALTRAGAK